MTSAAAAVDEDDDDDTPAQPQWQTGNKFTVFSIYISQSTIV